MKNKEAKEIIKQMCAELPFNADIKDVALETAIKALDNDIKEHLIADIKSYECDCRLSQDDDLICKRCNDNLFQAIYKIIERNFEDD